MTFNKVRVFIGGIGSNVDKQDVEREFSKFGKINSVWVAQNPHGFAFVEFEERKDADEAISQLNGQQLFDENKIRVEHSRDSRSGRGGMRSRGFGGRGGGGGGFRSNDYNRNGGGPGNGFSGRGRSSFGGRSSRSDRFNSRGRGNYNRSRSPMNYGQSSRGGFNSNNGRDHSPSFQSSADRYSMQKSNY